MMRSGHLAVSLAAVLLASGLAQGQAAGAAPQAPEWVAGQVRVVFTNLTHAEVSGEAALHKVVLSGSQRSAQDLRAMHANLEQAGMGDAFVAGMEAALAQRVRDSLVALFPGADVEVRARADRATLAPAQGSDAWHPPVRAAFEATVDADLDQVLQATGMLLDEGTVRAALDIGAVAEVPYALTAQPGWNVTYAFTLPPGLVLARAAGARLSPEATTASFALSNWQGLAEQRLPAELTLRSRDAPSQLGTDARVELGIDMSDVQGLTLPGVLSGDFGSLAVTVDARVVLRSLRLADVPGLGELLEGRLPASVHIDGFNADGMRLALREGLVQPEGLAKLQDYFDQAASARVQALTGQGGEIHGAFAAGALDAAHLSQPLDGDPPLVYDVIASFAIPLKSEPSRLQAAGGPHLVTRTLTFHVPRVQGLDTSYRILLPAGIAAADVRVTDGDAQRSTEGGRDVVTVTPQGDDTEATLTIAVTGEFVLAKFWYLPVGLLLVVAAGVAALLLLRRRRRRPLVRLAEPEPESAAPAPVPRASAEEAARDRGGGVP